MKPGDIIINEWAGEHNPSRKLLFLRKSSVKQGRYTHKTYECLNYRGEKKHLFRDDERITVIGHMKEYDDFIEALKELKTEAEK